MLSRQEFFARARNADRSTEELYLAYEAYLTCPALRGRGLFQCGRCGSCCRRPWRVEASVCDVQRWIAERRLDIIEKLEYVPKAGPPRGPTPREAGSPEAMCPGLPELDESITARLAFALAAARENAMIVAKGARGCVHHDGSGCAIYETRPGVCERFPDAGLFEGLVALLEER